MDVEEHGPKLRRGRISLERKKEILAHCDQLGESCLQPEVAAKFGVTTATLVKILSDRDEITKTDATQKEIAIKKAQEKPVTLESNPKLKRGRLSYEKQKELLSEYDELLDCSYAEAAQKLGVREATLVKLLESRRSINAGKRKRKPSDDSSSSDDDSKAPGVPQALGHRQQSRSSGIDPQPGSSRVNMTLRKGRRVRVDYSEDEKSSSDDYVNEDTDPDDNSGKKNPKMSIKRYDSDDYVDENSSSDEKPEQKDPIAHKKRYTREERETLLAKYDELKPIPQWRAAQILGITQSTLSNWLHHRSLASKKSVCREKYQDSLSEEEIDCYVLGSTNGKQVVHFFEVKENPDSTPSIVRKPHLTLREKYEILQKYDAMSPEAQRNAAATFNINKSTWFNLISHRHHYEQRFKRRLMKDMERLKQYDKLENKTKTSAARALKLQAPALSELLQSRDTIEKYYNEIVEGDADSVGQSVDEEDGRWDDSKQLVQLETELLQWSKQEREGKVNLKMLKSKAKELAVELAMDGFYPSYEWLRKWDKTHNVLKNKDKMTVLGYGENQSVTECVLMALKDYPPTNVYNLVTTGLYYRAVAGHPPVTNDWLSMAVVCNMSGTEKKRLLVASRSEAPLCFKVMALPLVYKHSTLGCLTEELVSDFLQEWDRELQAEDASKDIALILDSSSCQPSIKLSRISLFFVPTESSKEQPLSGDVVSHTKALYRKRMAESLETASFNAGQISITDALFALAQAWENVPKSLLVSEFLKVAFPHNSGVQVVMDNTIDEELERLNDLDDEIQSLSASGVPLSLHLQDVGTDEHDGGLVVHMEGTLKLSDEEEDDFDIDSLLREEVVDYPDPSDGHRRSEPTSGSKLKLFLQLPSTPNGSVTLDPNRVPTADEVKGALATIKRFLQLNACTLEDLTDYTQLESKVLTKINDLTPESKRK